MESPLRFSLLKLIPSLLILSIIILNPSSCYGEEKVELALYYETLCPSCSDFIVNLLPKIFDDGLAKIVNLKFIPYGNAIIGLNNTIYCQHGSTECWLNTIEACAIHVWPNWNEYFPFIYCVERLIYEGKYLEWETCYDKLNLDPEPVSKCYSSGYGHKLELRYAEETDALQPRLEYVPWVVVNGEALRFDYELFESYICKAYKGTKVPEACSELSLRTIRKERENQIHPVCYAEGTAK